jgi:hypothetical protein
MFLIHRTSNDKTLSVPVAQQLYGLLPYATSQGEFLFENGSRSLADELGVAPMTVGEAMRLFMPFLSDQPSAHDRAARFAFDAQRLGPPVSLGARIQERQKERH